jgi:hypothetical protein
MRRAADLQGGETIGIEPGGDGIADDAIGPAGIKVAIAIEEQLPESRRQIKRII